MNINSYKSLFYLVFMIKCKVFVFFIVFLALASFVSSGAISQSTRVNANYVSTPPVMANQVCDFSQDTKIINASGPLNVFVGDRYILYNDGFGLTDYKIYDMGKDEVPNTPDDLGFVSYTLYYDGLKSNSKLKDVLSLRGVTQDFVFGISPKYAKYNQGIICNITSFNSNILLDCFTFENTTSSILDVDLADDESVLSWVNDNGTVSVNWCYIGSVGYRGCFNNSYRSFPNLPYPYNTQNPILVQATYNNVYLEVVDVRNVLNWFYRVEIFNLLTQKYNTFNDEAVSGKEIMIRDTDIISGVGTDFYFYPDMGWINVGIINKGNPIARVPVFDATSFSSVNYIRAFYESNRLSFVASDMNSPNSFVFGSWKGRDFRFLPPQNKNSLFSVLRINKNMIYFFDSVSNKLYFSKCYP